MQLSQHTPQLSGVNQGGKILMQGHHHARCRHSQGAMFVCVFVGFAVFGFFGGFGCIALNIHHISVIPTAEQEMRVCAALFRV